MSSEATTYSIDSGIATITLDQPDNRNALSVALVNSLGERLDSAIADDAVRVIILTNSGTTFCAGADLSAPTRTVEPSSTHRTFVDILEQMITSPKPVVGRINGHCMGGGVGLAAACDISVASTEAKLGFTEVRLGVAPAVISVVCLPKLKLADAKELFLTGERISAERAADVGLINRAADPDQLDNVITEITTNITRGGPTALTACKELIARVPHEPRATAFEWTATFSGELFRTDEAREGIAAFKERRPASWIPNES